MNGSRLFTVLNEYPVFPIMFTTTNSLALIPVASVLYIAQIAPLHNNCRYILCVWTLSYATIFLLNLIFAVIDSTNASGFMPVNMFEPHLRFVLYKAHVTCTVFCSMFEIVLSTERRVSIIKPRVYHFSEMAWKALVPLTLLLMFFAYAVDYCVHNKNGWLVFIGCSLLNIIEITVVAVGAATTRACRSKYEEMYGNSTLTARYQVNEAYEMSRAMMPGYFLSFLLKASTIVFLCVYLAVRKRYEYLLGYLEAYYFLIDSCNGSFSMIFLIFKHPQLRKHAMRKLRLLMGLRADARIATTTNKQNAEIHFNQLAVYWK